MFKQPFTHCKHCLPHTCLFLFSAFYMPKYCLTHLLCWVSHTFWGKLIRLYWFGFQVGGEISGFYQCLLTGETHSCSLFLTAGTAWRRAAELFSISSARKLDAPWDTEVIYHPDPPPPEPLTHTHTEKNPKKLNCAHLCFSLVYYNTSVCMFLPLTHCHRATHTAQRRNIVTLINS